MSWFSINEEAGGVPEFSARCSLRLADRILYYTILLENDASVGRLIGILYGISY